MGLDFQLSTWRLVVSCTCQQNTKLYHTPNQWNTLNSNIFIAFIVQKAFDPPTPPTPPSFEHYVVNFSEGILTKVHKRLLRQLSTK